MNPGGFVKQRISPALATGLAAFCLALVLSLYRLEWAVAPLSVFVFLCLAAPFRPANGFFLPVVSRGSNRKPVVSITFDDGPDPLTTKPLLQLLGRRDIKATFFVTGENAAANGDLMMAILEQGHDIGNHSYHHDPFLMLRSSKVIEREIESTQTLLHRFGISPVAFRPPVGITNPKLAAILHRQGLYCLMFSCRAADFGNRRLAGLSRKILQKVQADDIILLHDTRPKGKGSVDAWLCEVDLILSGLKQKGLQVIPLAELIRQPVMVRFS